MSFLNSRPLETPASAGKLALSRGLGCGRGTSCIPKLKPCNPTTAEAHICRETQEVAGGNEVPGRKRGAPPGHPLDVLSTSGSAPLEES